MRRRALCSLVAVLLERGQGLFFELRPTGQGSSECFKANPGHGHWLVGSYEADGPTEGVAVRVTDAHSRELWQSSDASSTFNIEVMEEGQHRLCFESSVGQAQTVSFNFHVAEHLEEDPHSDGHKTFVTQEHTTKVAELVRQLEFKAGQILDQQLFAATREAVHRGLAESTCSRVMWWTLLEVAFLIGLAVFQVYHLRSYFEMKQLV
eukprot:CAMPEP_0204584810 /NCGR_PEP_ID=MMETSP0661-20131031/46553_1 /ASSEMBLY_ACC=CAM_ASM_000606 /TAXON_ID=109239 /ORGANISM="Alexandrium margalefi, Strain AMGDE01CS-322" /LENGTH=206 /DNA_ID=CAMNT_0051594303 /DNA_START=56 /DNA_END=676 /DNA_ORIENTATION=+